MYDYIKNYYVKKERNDKSVSIVVVVSPLVSLMKDQVRSYRKKGLACTFIGEEAQDAEELAVQNGEYQVVYSSPESLLTVRKWRDMLSSELYTEQVAHCNCCR